MVHVMCCMLGFCLQSGQQTNIVACRQHRPRSGCTGNQDSTILGAFNTSWAASAPAAAARHEHVSSSSSNKQGAGPWLEARTPWILVHHTFHYTLWAGSSTANVAVLRPRQPGSLVPCACVPSHHAWQAGSSTGDAAVLMFRFGPVHIVHVVGPAAQVLAAAPTAHLCEGAVC